MKAPYIAASNVPREMSWWTYPLRKSEISRGTFEFEPLRWRSFFSLFFCFFDRLSPLLKKKEIIGYRDKISYRKSQSVGLD